VYLSIQIVPEKIIAFSYGKVPAKKKQELLTLAGDFRKNKYRRSKRVLLDP
jgi:hypothetical protein